TTRDANAAGSDSTYASRPDVIGRPHAPSGVVTTGMPWRNASRSLMLIPNGPKSGAIIAADRAYTAAMSRLKPSIVMPGARHAGELAQGGRVALGDRSDRVDATQHVALIASGHAPFGFADETPEAPLPARELAEAVALHVVLVQHHSRAG